MSEDNIFFTKSGSIRVFSRKFLYMTVKQAFYIFHQYIFQRQINGLAKYIEDYYGRISFDIIDRRGNRRRETYRFN